MKKILSVLMLLMAGVAAFATETVLWEGNYSDGIEINSETIATFKAGDVLCVYVTVPEGGANFKICYKGAGNGWSETAIPSLNNQWPWVNSGQNTFEITLTGDDLTALSGENIYIYQGDNSVITKVTLKSADADPEPEPEPEPEVPAFSLDNFTADDGNSYDAATHTLTVTNAWSGGQLWIGENSTYSGSKLVIKTTEDSKLKVLVGYVGGGDVDMMDSEATKKHMLEIDNTKKIEKVIIQNQEATAITFESMELDPEEEPEPEPEPEPEVPAFSLDNFTADDGNSYDAATHTLTVTNAWSGGQLWIGENSTYSGSKLVIKTTEDSKLKVLVGYVGGGDVDMMDSEATKKHMLEIDDTKKIEKVIIQNQEATAITFESMELDPEEEPDPEPEPEPEPEVPAFSLDNFTADDGNSYDATTHTLTVTNAWSGGQLWIGENSTYSGSKLVIKTTEDSKLKVLVGYVGGGEVDMMDSEATKKHMLEIDDTKKIEKVIIQNQEATTVTFESMELDPEEEPEPEPEPVSNTFDENGVADLSKVEVQNAEKVTYDAETHTVTTTEGWTGVQLTVSDGEEVSGKELRITFDREMSVKCYVKYTDGTDADVIMGKAEKILYFTLDDTKKLYQVQIQPTDAATFAFEEIAVNAESTKPVVKPLEEGETRVIFKDEAGLAVSWNNFCEKDAEWGAVLEAGEYFFVTVSARDPRQEWPKIVLRDASSAAVGEDIDLNGVSSFPFIARFALTDGMVEQLRNGFCFSGDGFTVTQVAVYKPETGGESVSLDALNYTLNARYDVLSHNITTTRRWGRAGWEIDGDEYADRTLIVVDYKSVAFPVTLKIEYTTEDGVRMGYSAGSAAGNTQVSLDIPLDMASLKLIYITYPDGNSLELTDITLMAAANARPLAGERILPTAVDSLEAVEEDSEDDGVWYNLSGQRVDRPAHGIYIRNGRKVFIK